MVKRLAVIPARKGSKRIKNKNIKLFFNKPIFFYSIETAFESRLFDTIHLSTDCSKILKLGMTKGLKKVPLRKKILSGDKVPLIEVIKQVNNYYEQNKIFFDEIWLIMACAPLLNVSDLKGAEKLFSKHKREFPLMPVTKYSAPIQRANTLDKNYFLKKINKKSKNNSQNYKEYYHDAGSFAIFPKNTIVSKSKDFKWLGYLIPKERSIDIDDMSDWKIAESLFKSI